MSIGMTFLIKRARSIMRHASHVVEVDEKY